jgi:hypothetical protein
MGLMDEIAEEQDAARIRRCPVSRLLSDMTGDDRKDLVAAIDDHAIKCVSIAGALERRGARVSANALRNHRRGACACPRG